MARVTWRIGSTSQSAAMTGGSLTGASSTAAESQAACTSPVFRSNVPKHWRYIPSLSRTDNPVPQASASTLPKIPWGLVTLLNVNPTLSPEAKTCTEAKLICSDVTVTVCPLKEASVQLNRSATTGLKVTL